MSSSVAKSKVILVSESASVDSKRIKEATKEFPQLEGVVVFGVYDGKVKALVDTIQSMGNARYNASNQYVEECKGMDLVQKAVHFCKRYALVYVVVPDAEFEHFYQDLSQLVPSIASLH